MPQYGIGQSQVALGVFEVDGIDLVGHGRRADFAFHGFLLEVAQRDIAPDVAIEINQDGVEAADGIEKLGNVVVGFDLGGVGVKGKRNAFDESTGVALRVHFGVGGQVGVVVAHCAVDLAQYFDAFNLLELALQAIGDVRHLLAQGSGAGGLAVGARQHGQGRVLVSQLGDGVDNVVHDGQ